MNNQSAQTMPECTCRDNEGCTKPCDRKACQPVPLTEELLIEAAILSGDTPQERRLQKVLTKAAAALAQTSGVVDDPLSGKYGDVLRPFVIQMERELHANAGKGDRPGWLKMSPEVALLEIYYHLAKLQKAVKDDNGTGIQEYAADVANMSMMLLDICGGLALIDYAAPAASGAHPDALPDGTLSKSTVKRVEALSSNHNLVTSRLSSESAASVSEYTTGHCSAARQPGGCPHHNLLCGWPECDRKPVERAISSPRQEGGDAHSPSYDALLLIAQSVCGALARAGLTDCDDPGEAIDVMREDYERRIVELTIPAEQRSSTNSSEISSSLVVEQREDVAVRELVKRILNWQPFTSINKSDRLYQILISAGIPFESVTDELESLLSAASGEGVGRG